MLFVISSTNSEHQELMEIASVLGHDVLPCAWNVPKEVKDARPLSFIYGTDIFCKSVAKDLNLKYDDKIHFRILRLPEEYLGRKIQFMSFTSAKELSEPKFIKCASGYPFFAARVYDKGKDLPNYLHMKDDNVFVSDPLTITSEYRCFVKNNKVVSVCCFSYKSLAMKEKDVNNKDHYGINNEAVINFVDNMLKDKRVGNFKSAVIDVGRYKKDTYCVLNIRNPCSAALYGCEKIGALDAIQAAVEPIF